MKTITTIRNRAVQIILGVVLLITGVSASGQNGTWTNFNTGTGSASGSWAAAANWLGGITAAGANNTADFSTLDISADSTVTLDGARTIGNVIFADTGSGAANNWNLTTGTGGPLTLSVSSGQPTLTANTGSNNIAAVLASQLAFAGFAKNGNGLIRLSAANLITNAVNNINAGILQMANNNSLGYTNPLSNVVGSNNVAGGATLQVLVGIQPVGQRIFIGGAGQGGTNGALRADAGSGNQQNTRWSIALNSLANPAIVLTNDATIRVDGTGYGSQAGFLVGAITNNTSGLAYTLTVTGTSELRVDAPVPIAVASIHLASGILGINSTALNGITGTTAVTVDSGAALGCRRNRSINSSGVNLALNGFLDLNYTASGSLYSDIIGSLSGSGTITNSSLASTMLFVTSATSNSIFNGTIGTGPNGAITLRKEGQNTTMWLNNNSTYFGTNIVAGGIQYIDGAWNPTNGGFIVGPQSGATTATLAGKGSTVTPIILSSGGFVSAGDPTSGGGTLTISNITGPGGVIISNANLNVTSAIGSSGGYAASLSLTNGTLTVPLVASGPSAFVTALTVDGAATISYTAANPAIGQFPLIAYSSLGGLAGGGTNGITLIPPAGTTAYLSNNIANSTLDVVVSGIPALTWNGNVNGNWNIGTTANWLNGVSSSTYTETAGSGPFVLFDNTASGATSVNVAVNVSPKGMTANNSSKNYTLSGVGILASTGNLLKQGSGTLTLANTNSFGGGITISAGVVQIGSGGTSGSLSGAIANSGQLTLNRSDSFTVGPVSGTGNIVKQNSSTATVSMSGTISGAVTINGGTLAIASGGSPIVSGDVTGVGALGMSGPGTLILESANNTYSGGTVIQNGTLQIGDNFGSGSLPAGNVTDNGALTLASSATIANNISGSGGVSVINGAAITLSGANNYNGSTIVLGSGSLTTTAASYPSNSVLTLGSQGGNADVGAAIFTAGNPVLGGLNAGGNSINGDPVSLSAGGQTLFINGNVSVGNVAPAGASVYLPVTGSAASLTVNTNGGTFQIGLGNFSTGVNPDNILVDFSGIDNFTANLGTNGTFNLGTLDGNPGPTAGATVVNQLKLAAVSNSITAGSLTVGAGGRQLTPDLRLGPGTNILNVGTLNIGMGNRDGGSMEFNTGSGGVQIRGAAGGSTAAAYNQGANASAVSASGFSTTVDFTGGTADLLFGPMVIGNEPSRVGNWANTFTFSQGVFNAASVSLSRGCRNGTAGSSTMNINGGVAALGAVSLTASSASGTLSISGATVTVNAITATGGGSSTLSLANATLNMTLTNNSNPVSAPIVAQNFSSSGTVNLGLNATNLTTGQFKLISYTGSVGGDGFNSLNLISLPLGVGGYLSNNIAALSVDVVITNAPALVNTNSTNIVAVVNDSNLELSWPADHIGWRLQMQTNSLATGLGTNWVAIAGSAANNHYTNTIDATKPTVFYRMIYP